MGKRGIPANFLLLCYAILGRVCISKSVLYVHLLKKLCPRHATNVATSSPTSLKSSNNFQLNLATGTPVTFGDRNPNT